MALEPVADKLTAFGMSVEDIDGVTADLAKSTAIAFFEQARPERFINVGIAEQNLMGIGAGLAKSGPIPFASTFATFASMRAAEQVRTDICYQNLRHRCTSGGGSGAIPAGAGRLVRACDQHAYHQAHRPRSHPGGNHRHPPHPDS